MEVLKVCKYVTPRHLHSSSLEVLVLRGEIGSLAPPGGVGLVGCDAWLSRPLLLYSFSDFVDLRWGDSYHNDEGCTHSVQTSQHKTLTTLIPSTTLSELAWLCVDRSIDKSHLRDQGINGVERMV
ncbi:hypothetical protein E2C01_015674 [Portunus trituberculatus]|uniref:Uncharacterized protein n=1 Tax=Portunus trituberculatus TaxID=210409 RepID=A0A5B7DNQ7_PORTR|nr:hypothetical protein [Portunus trituberculatus]